MRKLCFGGSFNPIHLGHLICARSVAETAGFDKVVLIPSGQPPHKAGLTNIAAPEHRLAMCQAAVAGDSLFEVSDIEVSRPGSSFTIDTARQLRAVGWPEVVWLIGADMALFLPQWHQPLAVLAEIEFRLMSRPGSPLDFSTLPEPFRKLEKQLVPAPMIDISSTEIRLRVSAGKSIHYLTTSAVADYIHDHRLYQI